MLYEKGNQRVPTDWATPPEIVQALGPFDLDPCSSRKRVWDTAQTHYCPPQDGLALPWFGTVWLNPPYGVQIGSWLRRLCEHGSGIAIVFARTDAEWFFRYVWPSATGVFFFRGRLRFYRNGEVSQGRAWAPSVLVAYGKESFDRLKKCGLSGRLVWLMADS